MDYRKTIRTAARFVVRYRLNPNSKQFQVTIEADDGGLETPSGGIPDGAGDSIELDAISSLAGYFAEWKLLGADNHDDATVSREGGFEQARRTIARIDGDSEDAEAKCIACVNRHWPEITRLANELLVRKTILGDEAELICDVATGVADVAELVLYRTIVHGNRQIDH